MNTWIRLIWICFLGLGVTFAQKLVIGPAEKLYDNASIPGDPLYTDPGDSLSTGDFVFDGALPSLRGSGEMISVFSSGFAGTTRYRGTLKQPLMEVEYFRERANLYPNPEDSILATGGVHAWILGIYKVSPGHLLGFLHLEDQNTCPPDTFYCGEQLYRIGIAYSVDDGFTWDFCGDIVKPQMDSGGWYNVGGVPYLVVGDYFYVYYNEHPADGSPQRISVARAEKQAVITAAQGGTVTSWVKYNDSLGGWPTSNNGLTGVGSMIIPSISGHAYPANVYDSHSDAVYCRPLKKYFLLINVKDKATYLFSSKDGVAWGEPRLIDSTASISGFPNRSVQHAFPTFMALTDATDDGREVGRTFYVLYPIKPVPIHGDPNSTYFYDDIYRRKITVSQDITPSLTRMIR